MPEFRHALMALLMSMLCIASLQAAPLSTEQLQQQIAAFKHSSDYQLAPRTLQRAEAYLGAAMLAQEQGKSADAKTARNKTIATLAEARQTASRFKQQFTKLLSIRRDATSAAQITSASNTTAAGSSPIQTVKQANKEFSLAITSYEQGKLNQTRSHADNASQRYKQSLQTTLPILLTMAARTAGKAAVAGAKHYAPQTYRAANDKLNQLNAFISGTRQAMPEHPEEALYLARAAVHLTEQAKTLRRKKDSFEKITLKDHDLKLLLADALGIHHTPNAILANIDGRELLSAIKKLQRDLNHERSAHQQDIARLKKTYQQDLQRKLADRTNQLTQAQQSRMSTIKEAFKVKLERETFEKKRQQKLHKLFKKGEVEILLNLDGSLLIRLVSLKFGSGKSKIDAKYYDMLGRLKQAMDIYQDRSLRIEGHTDNHGDVKPNQILSLKRAEAVRDFLTSSGADGTRIKALGYGEVRPIASNDFPQGRAMNRRIDVVINAPK